VLAAEKSSPISRNAAHKSLRASSGRGALHLPHSALGHRRWSLRC